MGWHGVFIGILVRVITMIVITLIGILVRVITMIVITQFINKKVMKALKVNLVDPLLLVVILNDEKVYLSLTFYLSTSTQ